MPLSEVWSNLQINGLRASYALWILPVLRADRFQDGARAVSRTL